jgi:hypothetical protein
MKIIDDEVVVELRDGCSLRSGSDSHTSGDYVKVCDAGGEEIGYWIHTEWEEDPVGVMGAIINMAAGARVEPA